MAGIDRAGLIAGLTERLTRHRRRRKMELKKIRGGQKVVKPIPSKRNRTFKEEGKGTREDIERRRGRLERALED